MAVPGPTFLNLWTVPRGMKPCVDRIDQHDEDNRNRAGRVLRRADPNCARRDDDVDLEPDEVLGEGAKALGMTFRPPIFDRHGLALDPAQVPQTPTERQ